MTNISIHLHRIKGAADEINRVGITILRMQDIIREVSVDLPDLGHSDEILAANLRDISNTLTIRWQIITKMATALRMAANLYQQTDVHSAENKPAPNKGVFWTPVPVYPGKLVTVRWINHGFDHDEPKIEYLRDVYVKHPPKPKVMRFVTVKPERLLHFIIRKPQWYASYEWKNTRTVSIPRGI